jgi:molybdenum cofactor cytidylyltransferase
VRQDAVVVVLAAGRGVRFRNGGTAGHKLGQPFGQSTVLGTTLAHAVQSGMPVVVVTTAGLVEHAAAVLPDEDIVVLPEADGDARLGMGYSIAAGVSARSHASGWLLLPGDMPLVQPGTLRAVRRELQHHPVAYAQHQGRRGHPVAFAAELYSELATLSGDEGARRLVARYPAHGVDVHDAGSLLDLDTEDDLQRLRALHEATAS